MFWSLCKNPLFAPYYHLSRVEMVRKRANPLAQKGTRGKIYESNIIGKFTKVSQFGSCPFKLRDFLFANFDLYWLLVIELPLPRRVDPKYSDEKTKSDLTPNALSSTPRTCVCILEYLRPTKPSFIRVYLSREHQSMLFFSPFFPSITTVRFSIVDFGHAVVVV